MKSVRTSKARSHRRPAGVHVAGRTDVGRVRRHNEDYYLIVDLVDQRPVAGTPRDRRVSGDGSLLVVADGMGGAAAGEIASEMAANAIYAQLAEAWRGVGEDGGAGGTELLRAAFEVANDAIHAYAASRAEIHGMGTTATAALLRDGTVSIAHVGDCRAYLVRDGMVNQLTKDHSLIQLMVDAGRLSVEEAARSDGRNVILQALGPKPTLSVEALEQPVHGGDVLVLCSDGLWGDVRSEEIATTVTHLTDLSVACETLIRLANERGGHDNVTVVLARFPD